MADNTVTALANRLLTRVDKLLQQASPFHVFPDGRLNNKLLEKARLRLWADWQAIIVVPTGSTVLANKIAEIELSRVAVTIALAIVSPFQVDWDVERFADRVKVSHPFRANPEHRKKLAKYVAISSFGCISEPATFVDQYGKILAWYLPQILDLVNKGIVTLAPVLDQPGPKSQAWRSQGYIIPPDSTEFGIGRVTLCPGGFMQWQERLQDNLYQSTTLSSPVVQDWLCEMTATKQFWSAITRVVAPDQYHAGMESVSSLNSVTPYHRDPGASASMYDLLVSLGKGHKAILDIPDLGAELVYEAGAMVFICGRVLEHGVPFWGDGERVVIAHFMKDKVHERLGVPRPSFPSQKDFLDKVGAGKKGGLKAIQRGGGDGRRGRRGKRGGLKAI
ncbi:hypothetical protein EV424DRAFT_1543856 [Suillus variegatus]|nr:hypothetical protein EV424DRAFT_1543856 [Suillus variegatus]